MSRVYHQFSTSGSFHASLGCQSVELCQMCSLFNGRGIVRKLTKAVIQFLKKADGPTAVEYAIMLALIVTICIGVITTIGSNGSVISSHAPACGAIMGE
jgi:pilus assembly protein Flp/PilA